MGLSSDETAREAQLANLTPAPPAPLRNDRSLKHGAYSALVSERQADKVREIFDAISEDAPLRERDQGLPAADTVTVELLAETIVRRVGIRTYLADQERQAAEAGEAPRPDVSLIEVERRLRLEASKYCDQLGLTPQSRNRIGLDMARTGAAVADLSTALSEPDPARRRQLLLDMGRPDLVDDPDQEGDE